MKISELLSSVIIHLFLGYLWLLFFHYFYNLAISTTLNYSIGVLMIMIGSALFGMIITRISPFHTMKFSNPVKIIGLISFFGMIVTHVFIINLV